MTTIPTVEPTQLRAGDTWQWRRNDLSAYPATAWQLKYYLLKAGTQIVITATADGLNYRCSVAATVTATYPSGIYAWIAKVSKGAEEYTISDGSIDVLPHLAAAATGYETRSHVKRVLDSIEAAIEGRATRTDLSYTIAGRSIQHIPPAELIKWHTHYKRLYADEQATMAVAKGRGGGRKIITRFKQ